MSAKVMVIDDSATVRIQAGRALSAVGFEIVEAVDGQDALDKLAVTKVNLIVCDVNMPRMSGIEFLQALAQRQSQDAAPMPPVIMLTTEGHPRLIQQAKSSGAKGWMMKPFKPELLVAAVQKLAAA